MQGRSRILVIEDDPMFRSLVVSLLRKDYLIAVASNGKSGLEKAIGHRPDLVILDHQMPGWDGVTTLKEFRKNPVFHGTKFVMLTGDATKETVLAAIQAGTDDYVIKSSFSKDMFIGKINRLLAPTLVKAIVPTARKVGYAPAESVAASANGSDSSSTATASETLDEPFSDEESESDVEVEYMMDEWE
ncbi:response regulator [Rubinisphaera margarita]|uniref:response regulator n=1 Tax=Rubinisphaera margarita TaxID=2909586 RepID=UPI001EE7B12B|nr:response regulator [Rubinisphaera margarita]MCG6154566.1 response regulator [Rubinisphaera margarita]